MAWFGGLVLVCCLPSLIPAQFIFGPDCPDRPADVVFLLDGSGSESQAGFQKELDFVQSFSHNFDIGSKAMQIGVVQFATGARPEFQLKDSVDANHLTMAIRRVQWWNGETYTADGLAYVRTHSFQPINGGRTRATPMVVVLTDGQSSNTTATAIEAGLLKRDRVTVVAIGIGSLVNRQELEAIASDPKHVFTVSNFDLLKTIQAELHDTTCKLCDTTPIDLAFLLDGSGSEHYGFQDERNFIKSIADNFRIGPNDHRVAVGVFSTEAKVSIPFSKSTDRASMDKNVDAIVYPDGESNLHLGLDLLSYNIFNEARYGVKRIAIVLTDGHSTERELTALYAQHLKNAGVLVLTVGLGSNVLVDQLRLIASNNSLVFITPQLSTVRDLVLEVLCRSHFVYTTPPPTTTTPKPTTTTPRPTTTTPKPTTTTPRPTTTTPKPTTTIPRPTTPKPRLACGPQPADIVFLLDSSDSEGPDNFELQKQFVMDFANQFVIGPSNTQISVLTFSDKANNIFWLNTFHTREDVIKAVQNISYIGSSTNTADGLYFARTQSFTKAHGMRDNANHVAVVITDGRSNNETQTLLNANLLKQQKVTIISIGIGLGEDHQELTDMASNKNYVFTTTDFKALHTIQSQFTAVTCHEVVDQLHPG